LPYILPLVFGSGQQKAGLPIFFSKPVRAAPPDAMEKWTQNP